MNPSFLLYAIFVSIKIPRFVSWLAKHLWMLFKAIWKTYKPFLKTCSKDYYKLCPKLWMVKDLWWSNSPKNYAFYWPKNSDKVYTIIWNQVNKIEFCKLLRVRKTRLLKSLYKTLSKQNNKNRLLWKLNEDLFTKKIFIARLI